MAINDQGHGYVATDRANPGGQDHMVFIWVGGVAQEMFNLPWGKKGQIAGPTPGGVLFALIQEESTGYCELNLFSGTSWFSMGSNGCSVGTILEASGSIVEMMGLTAPNMLPPHLYFTAVKFNTGSGDQGSFWSSSQTPPCINCGDDLITPDEVMQSKTHRANILVGRIKEVSLPPTP